MLRHGAGMTSYRLESRRIHERMLRHKRTHPLTRVVFLYNKYAAEMAAYWLIAARFYRVVPLMSNPSTPQL